MKDLNRNRDGAAPDVTAGMIWRETKHSEAYAWLRTLRAIRELPQDAP